MDFVSVFVVFFFGLDAVSCKSGSQRSCSKTSLYRPVYNTDIAISGSSLSPEDTKIHTTPSSIIGTPL